MYTYTWIHLRIDRSTSRPESLWRGRHIAQIPSIGAFVEMPWVLRIHEIGCLSIKLFLVLFIPYGVSKKLKFDFGLFSAIKKGFKVNIV